jgi:hypothetical protein
MNKIVKKEKGRLSNSKRLEKGLQGSNIPNVNAPRDEIIK